MAELVEVRIVDDLDRASGKTTPATERLTVGLNGHVVRLDLTDEHAESVLAQLAPLMQAGATIELDEFHASRRKNSPARKPQKTPRTHAERMRGKRLRAWAMVHPRYRELMNPAGPFPPEVVKAWNETHPEDIYE